MSCGSTTEPRRAFFFFLGAVEKKKPMRTRDRDFLGFWIVFGLFLSQTVPGLVYFCLLLAIFFLGYPVFLTHSHSFRGLAGEKLGPLCSYWL